MTPTEIETAARNAYNAIGDSFFSSEEILGLLYDACLEMAVETLIIERVYSTTTVAGTQEYDFPTNTIAIKRVTYDGHKLRPITFREDDAVTGLDQSDTTQGTPQYYYQWNETIGLRPVPSAAETLKVYSYNEPSVIETTSTLEIPTVFHRGLVNYIVAEMALKDKSFNHAEVYRQKWEKVLDQAKKWVKRRKRTDGFVAVQDEDTLVETYLGTV